MGKSLRSATSDAGAWVEHDVPCSGCGYNLRGLGAGARCPECGASVLRSTLGNDLRYADSGWLETISRGISLLRWSILGQVALTLLAVVLGAALGVRSWRAMVLFGGIVGLAAIALALWSAFLVTTPEPRLALREDSLTLRRAVRYSAGSYFLGELFDSAGGLSGAATSGPTLELIGTILNLPGAVQLFGQFVYFRRFAWRIPDPKLATDTRTVMWAMGIAFGTMLLGALGIALIGRGQPGSGAMAGRTVAGIIVMGSGTAALIFGVWTYLLLVHYGKAFGHALLESRRWSGRA